MNTARFTKKNQKSNKNHYTTPTAASVKQFTRFECSFFRPLRAAQIVKSDQRYLASCPVRFSVGFDSHADGSWQFNQGERKEIKRRFLRDDSPVVKSSNCSRQSLLLGELNLQRSFPQKLSSASKYINSRQLTLREESFLEFQSLILATEVEIERSATTGKVLATVRTAASSDPLISARCD